MKAKTIRRVLKAKVESLVRHITLATETRSDDEATKRVPYFDSQLPKDVKEGTIVTGGCIISMLSRENPNDYDCYFKTRSLALRVARFFLQQFVEQNNMQVDSFIEMKDPRSVVGGSDEEGTAGWHRLPTNPSSAQWSAALMAEGRFRIVIKSAGIASDKDDHPGYAYFEQYGDDLGQEYIDAVTMTDGVYNQTLEEEAREAAEFKGPHHPKFISGNAITCAGDIQLIIRFWGEPTEIHENYDFIHCTCSYTSWDNVLNLPQEALEALITKELRYVGTKYPLCSVIRLRKFISRGWTINAGQILKILMNLNKLDLKDIATLEDQLTGVDAAYFCVIIERLTNRQEKRIAELIEKENLSRTQAEDRCGSIDTSYLCTIIDRMF